MITNSKQANTTLPGKEQNAAIEFPDLHPEPAANPNPNSSPARTFAPARAIKVKSLVLLTLLAGGAAFGLRAGTHTWTGAGFFGNQTYVWSDPANWSPVGAPEVGETNITLIFPDTGAHKFTTNDIAGLNVAAIEFLGTNYEIHARPAGTQLKLGGGAAGNWAMLVTADDCTFAKDCPLSLQTTGTVLVADGIFFDIHATLSGPGGFTKSGPGFLFLFGETANSYTGITIVGDGLLGLSQGTASPSGKGVSAVPGPLIVGGQPGITIPTVRVLNNDQISSSSPVTMLDPSEIMFWGTTNTFASLTMQSGANLSTGPLGDEDSWPGLLKLNGNVTTVTNSKSSASEAVIQGHVDLGAVSRTFNLATDSELWMRAQIHGGSSSAGITKTGGGQLDLDGQNTYDGLTLVQGGRLSAGGGDFSLGSTVNGTIVSAGGTLVIQDSILVNETLTLNGMPGVVTLDVVSGWTNSFAGPITLNGVCEVSVSDGGEGTLILSGNITGSGALRKTGAGVLELVGFGGNTFTGGLFAEQGVMRLNKSASAPAFSGPLVVGRTNELNLDVEGEAFVQQINQIPNNVPVTILSRGYLDGAAADTLGNVDIAGGILAGHTFTVTGNITNHAFPGGGSIEKSLVLAAGTHVIHCDSNSVLTVTGDLQGAGGITKTGAGDLQLYSTNSYAGPTTVQGGKLSLAGNARPGSSAAGTFIEAGGKLYLSNCSVTNETLTFDGASANGVGLESIGANRWAGPIVLNANAGIQTPDYLTLDGGISGVGGLSYLWFYATPPGTIELTGSSANTYTGDTVIQGGDLRLNKSTGVAVPGNLEVGGKTPGCNALLLHPNQIGDSSAVTIDGGDWLELNDNAETIGSLSGVGNVSMGAATLVTGGNGNSTTFSGLLYGTGGLTKIGGGTLTLAGDNSYTGPTTANGGTLLVNGQQPFSSLTIQSGATLGGTGRVGNMAINNGAIIAPGTGPGLLSSGNVNSLGSTATFQIEINGTAPGTYDQLAANGIVSMIGGALQVAMNIGGAVSNKYVIVSNDGGDPISGTFTGLPEGASLTNNGAAFVITYHGGDGNDIALIQQTVGYVSQIIGGQKLPNGRFAISALGAPNTTYRVDACTNLAAPIVWTQVGSAVANSAGNISFSDVGAPLYRMRFYRLRYP